jgi:hypothetical protein
MEVLTDKDVSSGDLERWYMETGKTIRGPCEVRQAWKFNDLTPRTYFAQGGDTYYASRYIRVVMNALVNAFPQTHFKSRFAIHSLPLSSEDVAFTYDYTSFTSNMTEFKYFLEELAAFVDDVMVDVLDTNKGVQAVSLGSLIRDYNDTCNREGVFTVNRYMPGAFEWLRHNRAGFLGVYGNIAGCTALHGLHACQLCGDNGDCRCVGDDVFGVFDGEFASINDIHLPVASLGEVNPSKVRDWPYRDELERDFSQESRRWPYTKRPLERFENQMILERAIFLPIFGAIVPFIDERDQTPNSVEDRLALLATQSLSLVRQICSLDLSNDQDSLVYGYVATLYEALHVPKMGVLPFQDLVYHGVKVTGLLFPRMTCPEDLRGDVWKNLERHWELAPPVLKVPLVAREFEPDLFKLTREREFESVMDRHLTLLKNLGCIETESMHLLAMMDYASYSRLYDEIFSKSVYRMYKITVVHLPRWIDTLVQRAAS